MHSLSANRKKKRSEQRRKELRLRPKPSVFRERLMRREIKGKKSCKSKLDAVKWNCLRLSDKKWKRQGAERKNLLRLQNCAKKKLKDMSNNLPKQLESKKKRH